MKEITVKDFEKLMLKRKRTVDDLVDMFRGKLDLSGNSEMGANDNSRSFFERVMSCQWRQSRYRPLRRPKRRGYSLPKRN
jgi:hypothetical protein